jgi:phosphatidylserine synthase
MWRWRILFGLAVACGLAAVHAALHHGYGEAALFLLAAGITYGVGRHEHDRTQL